LKIVIIGAGEIGYDLGDVLSEEKQDVTILDRDKKAINKVNNTLDVLTVEGNATYAKDLLKAGVDNADIVIAVTSIDEVNMIASMMSKRLGANMVIARVRSEELSREDAPLKPIDLGINVVIHPELSAAHEIYQLLKSSSASDLVQLADNKIQIIGIRLDKGSPLIGKTLIEYARKYSNLTFRVVSIARKGMTIMPRGMIKLQENDQIFIIGKTTDIPRLIETTGRVEQQISSIMIAGGTPIGEMLARMLNSDEQDTFTVKLIEPDRTRAEKLASNLPNTLVLHGNPTDPNLLASEGINETDAFISVTRDEESNIISCLMAKHLDVPKTVALVSKPDYIPLSQTIGLDAAINKKSAASDEIHRHVREGRVLSVTALHGVKAEVIELQANNGSKIVKKPVKDISFPDGCIVGGILSNGSVEIATGDSQIKPNDRVIIFTLPAAVNKVTRLFK